MGQGTTEIGLSQVFAWEVDDRHCSRIKNRHAIIWETIDQHLSKNAQARKIDIDDEAAETYPRCNFQGGPNSIQKSALCVPSNGSIHKVVEVSDDSEIIYSRNSAWWIIHQFPGASKISPTIKYPTAVGPRLANYQNCHHNHHEVPSGRPMRALSEWEDYSM